MAARRVDSKPGVSDDELVEHLLRGRSGAFDRVYERYFPRIYRFVERRMGNRADIEDTVQEVFINVFRSVGSFRREAPFAAWVFGLTRRTLASRFRRKRQPTVPLDLDEHDASTRLGPGLHNEPTPVEAYECAERLRELQHLAWTRLTAEQRLLIQLHHLEDFPIAEIARRLRKTEDAVKSNLYRARKVLLSL